MARAGKASRGIAFLYFVAITLTSIIAAAIVAVSLYKYVELRDTRVEDNIYVSKNLRNLMLSMAHFCAASAARTGQTSFNATPAYIVFAIKYGYPEMNVLCDNVVLKDSTPIQLLLGNGNQVTYVVRNKESKFNLYLGPRRLVATLYSDVSLVLDITGGAMGVSDYVITIYYRATMTITDPSAPSPYGVLFTGRIPLRRVVATLNNIQHPLIIYPSDSPLYDWVIETTLSITSIQNANELEIYIDLFNNYNQTIIITFNWG